VEQDDFHNIAEKELSSILEAIENVSDDIEVDLLDSILYITLPSGEEYAINKHSPTMQIWMASPKSGATHFLYSKTDMKWIDNEDRKLREMLSEELNLRI
jgi:iron-sulfur cluster assembly protein CyaY